MPTILLNGTHVKIENNFATVPFFLRTSLSSISSPSEGGTYDVSIFTQTLNPWTVTDSCTWITINNGSGTGDGTFSIVVDERSVSSEGTLSGRVTISSRAATSYIDVTQVAIKDVIILTPDSSIIAKIGIATDPVCIVDSYIAGAAKDGWTAAVTTGAAFISIDTASGQTGDPLVLTITENNDVDARYGFVEVSIGNADTQYFEICQNSATGGC